MADPTPPRLMDLSIYVKRLADAIDRANAARRDVGIAATAASRLRISIEDSSYRSPNEVEKAAMRSVLGATRAKLVADAEVKRDEALRAAALEIDAVRADLCRVAAACAVDLGGVSRDLRAECDAVLRAYRTAEGGGE